VVGFFGLVGVVVIFAAPAYSKLVINKGVSLAGVDCGEHVHGVGACCWAGGAGSCY